MARSWLLDLRIAKGFSQLGLAKEAGVFPPERYGRFEKGYTDLDATAIAGLAGVLGVTPTFITTGAHPPTLSPKPPLTVEVIPRGLAVASKSPPPNTVAEKAPEPALRYRGEEITDPQRFNVLPDADELALKGKSQEAFRTHLSECLVRTRKVLHTSKIPAKTWAAWRAHEKSILGLLDGSQPLPRESVVSTSVKIVDAPAPKPVAAPSVIPEQSVPRGERQRSHITKEALFLTKARELLPAPDFQSYERLAAEAKGLDPSMGFMKHFFRIAEAKMPPIDFQRLVALAHIPSSQPVTSR